MNDCLKKIFLIIDPWHFKIAVFFSFSPQLVLSTVTWTEHVRTHSNKNMVANNMLIYSGNQAEFSLVTKTFVITTF